MRDSLLPGSSFQAECNVVEKSVSIDFSLPDAGGHSATGEELAGSSRNDDFSTGSVNGSGVWRSREICLEGFIRHPNSFDRLFYL